MKKAKILLTGMAVFAVVGGVMATRANRGAIIYCTNQPNLTATSTVLNKRLTAVGAVTTYCTAVYSAPAPSTFTTTQS
ncbi:hypothetical protein [Pedobacter paludis]|uniref:Uncharacterized protein n=1 Tax=Pedobacter paludis TaxID=2203212 RepID=A0A317F0G0_9SPHI|nr:hypothetical protein [Pedobacter paludis]PWS32202.1 hypothetical protein DF947_10560 [Pedobacter paludis]